MDTAEEGQVYDLNSAGDFLFGVALEATLDGAKFRDALPIPSVHDPCVIGTIEILHSLSAANIELFGTSPKLSVDARLDGESFCTSGFIV